MIGINMNLYDEMLEHCVHVIVKKLQSIRCGSRWEDFIAGLNHSDIDLLLICETWRGEMDATFITEKGHHIYLSILAVVPIIKVLEFTFRSNSLHELHICPAIHIRKGSEACFSAIYDRGENKCMTMQLANH